MMQINGTHHSEFKETEIGLIPVDWDCVQLEELLVKTKNKDPRKEPDTTFRYIDVSSVSNEINRVTGYSLIMGMDAPSRARKVVASGDTIFATVRPYLRNIAQIPEELHNSICSTGYCVLRPEKNLLDANFLFFQTLTDFFIDSIVALQRGSSYPAVSDKVVKSRNIPIPPLPEQQRIAVVLNAIQDEIAVQDDLLRELREFKRSTMESLFTYGAGDTPAKTKMTEIGEFPVHWDDFLLNEVADLKYGYQTSIPKTPPQSGVDIISTAEIKNEGYLDLVKIRKVGVDVADVAQYLVRKDDVLFNWRNSQEHVGKTALVTVNLLEPTIYASFIVRIRPTNHVSHQYIHYLLSFLRDRGVFFERSRRAVNQANFNANQLGNLEIPIPSSSEQETIVDLLQGIDEKIAIEEDRKSALQDFFRTMLQQLMTGQIRLLSDDGLEGL